MHFYLICFTQFLHKTDFLKPGLPHFHELAKSRLVVEKTHCSSPEIYTSCRSCWITVLVLPTYVFGEAMLQTKKIHNLFI
jgi:hypothetical protein